MTNEGKRPSPETRGRLHAALWGKAKPVVGMVHLLPLPGAPGWGGSMDAVLDRALEEARILEEEGLDGLLVENFGDAPFFPGPVSPETLAAMAVITGRVVRAASVPVGINVLRNDAAGALGVAVATGARFLRVNVHTGVMMTDQGLVEGRAHQTLRRRRELDAPVALLADVLVKHAVAPAGLALEEAARDLWHRGLADGIVVSGDATGRATSTEDLRRVLGALPPGARVWVGSGVTAETARTLLGEAHGLIVGSALQREGRAGGGVERDRVRRLMDAVAPD
jgi:hypothetical protein